MHAHNCSIWHLHYYLVIMACMRSLLFTFVCLFDDDTTKLRRTLLVADDNTPDQRRRHVSHGGDGSLRSPASLQVRIQANLLVSHFYCCTSIVFTKGIGV